MTPGGSSLRAVVEASGLEIATDSTVIVELGDRRVVVGLEVLGEAIVLNVSLPGADDRLLDITLEEPGDTSVRTEPQPGAYRTLIRPSPQTLRTAAHRLAKAALLCEETLAAKHEMEGAVAAMGNIQEPRFHDSSSLERALAGALPQVSVASAQPAWDSPDPSGAPKTQLVPGRPYPLVDRKGDWARILLPDDSVAFTDGRTLTST
jgi:hypothetical protein